MPFRFDEIPVSAKLDDTVKASLEQRKTEVSSQIPTTLWMSPCSLTVPGSWSSPSRQIQAASSPTGTWQMPKNPAGSPMSMCPPTRRLLISFPMRTKAAIRKEESSVSTKTETSGKRQPIHRIRHGCIQPESDTAVRASLLCRGGLDYVLQDPG